VTTRRDREVRPAPDLVERNFTVEGPNRLWVADITFVPTAAGFLYLAVVLDAWSRRIVGWAMANHLRTELVLNALEMAVGQRRPMDVIHHSDQGSQGGLKRSSQPLGPIRRCSPMPTQCSADLFGFAPVEGRRVEAAFDGGAVTSDAGALLLGATDRAINLVRRFAECFADGRRSDLAGQARSASRSASSR
jgi:Integrase core domain/Transposase DDE domain group 1